MRVQLPRCVIVAAACLCLGSAVSAGVAAGSTNNSVNPSAAAATCATPRGHAGQPTKLNATKLASLVSCVTRAERKQLGLGYSQSSALSQSVNGALKQFIALPYLAQNQPQLASQAEQNTGHSILTSFCKNAGPGVSRGGWVFANRNVPPSPTPLRIAQVVATSLQASDAVARAGSAQFGVATRKGLLFRHGDSKGVSLGVMAVTCS